VGTDKHAAIPCVVLHIFLQVIMYVSLLLIEPKRKKENQGTHLRLNTCTRVSLSDKKLVAIKFTNDWSSNYIMRPTVHTLN